MSSSSYGEYVTMAATVAGTAMVLRGFVGDLVPDELRDMLSSWTRSLLSRLSRLSSRRTVVIDDTEGLSPNQLYDVAHAYLAARAGVRRLRASSVDSDDTDEGISVSMDQGEEMVDAHDGVEYTCRLVSRDTSPAGAAARAGTTAYGDGRGRGGCLEARSFEVSFHKKHKEKALMSYLPFVVATAKAIKEQSRSLKMHMIEYDAWAAVDLRHPSTNCLNESVNCILVCISPPPLPPPRSPLETEKHPHLPPSTSATPPPTA